MWVFAAVLIALLAATRFSYLQGLAFIRTSCDFKYDFIAAYWLGQGRSLEDLDRRTANDVGRQLGTVEGPFFGGDDAPSQTHPPPAALLVRPFVLLGYRAALAAWALMSAVALLFLARILLALWERSPTLPSWVRAFPFGVALIVWPPSVFNFGYGQWSALLALAIAAGWWNLERGAHRGAALWLAAALAIRATPVLLFGHLFLRARRVAVGAAAAFVGLVLLALPLAGGLGAWRVFFRSGPVAIKIWEGWIDNTVSLRGIFVRLFVETPYVHAALNHPALGRALYPAAAAVLIGVAFFFGRRRRGDAIALAPSDGPAFALWCCLVALLNPLSWSHNALVLLLPAVLIARDAQSAPIRWAVAAAVLLLTVPTQTLFKLQGQTSLPFPATRGWLLGLHALAGLILFATACARLRPRAAT